MTDIVDPETRSRMMAAIRGKNTRPERVIRSALHRSGFRFRLHDRRLPGTPDLILPRYRTVIFVHGCFWHRHAGCYYTTAPASRKSFWDEKFASNIARDHRHQQELLALNWRVLVVWECGVRHQPEAVLDRLTTLLLQESSGICEIPKSPPRSRV
ncbi:very short patch repair endonuclease [Natronospira bacteriovora]|uniref:Very short patch repair endonuclease n=1 Tax=Natronospira bacteriovora TaxID=3069753 RepID=A0ABU0W3Q4_9GAMM|nr:very short patch repair endonuclease [Natronospira sp. AB-CW4]MDQ2068651.1 very short patch repair endonuclease [Natronospira sp. AB-CW4]